MMPVFSPGEDAALGKQALVQLLPADAIVLHDRLVRNTKGVASRMAPIRRIKANRGLLERFAGAAESKETFCIQIREYQHQNIERQLGKMDDFVGHSAGSGCV